MTYRFDDEGGEFLALVNDEGQYAVADVRGHRRMDRGFGSARRTKDCLAYIDEQWTDMRPKSLIRQMEQDAAERAEAERPDAND